jgi:hypothetical protein
MSCGLALEIQKSLSTRVKNRKNNMKVSKFGLMFCLGALTVSQASANLVFNGGFENVSGTFADNTGQDTMNLVTGSTAIPGWTTTVAALAWIGPSNPFGLTAAQGSYFLDLTGYHDNTPYAGVAATSISTVIGTKYQVSFDIGSSTVYDSSGQPGIQVNVNGNAAETAYAPVTLANLWTPSSFIFTATSGSTTLEFDGVSPANSLEYIGLDNVDVTAVPESTTMVAGAMLLLPFGMSTLRMLRKSRIP